MNWQILGELEIPFRFDPDFRIDTWMTDLLNSLHLHADFQNKVLASALDAATRASKAENLQSFGHSHLFIFIFAPPNQMSEGQTWGFFRIEKIGHSNFGQGILGHAIELYLYREGS